MITVLTNAVIATSNDKMPFANTVAFEDEKISYVGNLRLDEVKSKFNDNAKIVDLNGRGVIPGVVDSHTHPGLVSQSAWHITLPWTENVDELLDFVRDYAQKTPIEEAPFLYFEYYPPSMFDHNGPTKELLDSAVSDRPCLCNDFTEHQHWLNSKMIELLGVTKDTPDPVPGLEMFVRDENGEPTGWAKDWAWTRFADNMYEKIGWRPPTEFTPDIMRPYFKFNAEHGITAIADARLEGESQIKSIYELDMMGELNIYYDGIVRFRRLKELPDKIAELRDYQKKYTSKHIKINTLKLFLDGTNEGGNSALLEPHFNDPTGTNYGEIQMETEELKECLLFLNREGLDIHIHVTGDRAFRVSCDATQLAKEEASEQNIPWTMQVILAHCEIIDPADMLRPAELGMTINWSCQWSGGMFGDGALPYLGQEKWEAMYQFNPIIESGALVTFSSDCVSNYELHRADLFLSMQIANTRVDPEYPLDPTVFPGSVRPPESAKLSRENILKGYTINGAKQLRWEHLFGSIEEGKLANMSVVSGNLFEVEADKISEINFDAVIFEGRVIHGKVE